MPPLLGAHVSIAGGLNLAIDRGKELGCDAIQVFTQNASQLKGRALDPDDVRLFREKAKAGPWPAMSHGSYLMNCGTPRDDLYAKSVERLKDELARCEALGIPYFVFHPGAYKDSTSEASIRRISMAVDAALAAHPKGKTVVCLENMAGAGTVLGKTFEELAAMRDGASEKARVGVCFDTCHAFAAGLDLTEESKYGETIDRFDSVLGLPVLKCFQFNDSKFDIGANKDRHEHIGKGHIGLECFRLLLNDKRFDGFPMVLETDPEDEEGTGWKKDLAQLRKLLGKKEPIKAKRKGQQRIG